jgi:hypothetical protein
MTDHATDDRGIDRILEAWLRPGPSDLPDERFASIVAVVGRTSQRRRLRRFGNGSVPRPVGRRLAAAAAALLLVTSAGALVLGARWSAGPATPAGPSTPEATVPPTATVIELAVRDLAFVPTDLYAPADAPFEIRLADEDTQVPLGLEILDDAGRSRYASEVATGVTMRTFPVPALPTGTYAIRDRVHPNTSGVLHVGSAEPTGPALSPSPAPTFAHVVITTAGHAFTPTAVSFPVGRRFFIELHNLDTGVSHGIAIDDATGTPMLRAGASSGPVSIYPVDAMPAGSYVIFDPADPAVRATLVVVGSDGP